MSIISGPVALKEAQTDTDLGTDYLTGSRLLEILTWSGKNVFRSISNLLLPSSPSVPWPRSKSTVPWPNSETSMCWPRSDPSVFSHK